MKKTLLTLAVTCVLTPLLLSFDLPKNWFKAGTEASSYEMETVKSAGPNGENVVTIKSGEQRIRGFGTLMQSCTVPKEYLGKKLKMTGMMKTENVIEWAGLWLRVDGKNDVLTFDNMEDRSITGTTGWKQYEIVLDVPKNAEKLAYGSLISGNGQVWFGNIRFEVVGVAGEKSETGVRKRLKLDAPANLDFKE